MLIWEIDTDAPIHLLPEEKLRILRSLDGFRAWESLDDQRYCLVCDHLINGRQIEVVNEKGSLLLRCPSEGCSSSPMDWALPTAAGAQTAA